ncbi:hypothetical protein WG901_08465 [Novosphingobium sp. PS1R-30]|uniref:Uncharacterized protein n=1 Tax=Novosphingobium anseongense TaxID=3133436 RepID=A0ABU8RU85_9SPHN
MRSEPFLKLAKHEKHVALESIEDRHEVSPAGDGLGVSAQHNRFAGGFERGDKERAIGLWQRGFAFDRFLDNEGEACPRKTARGETD